MRKLIVLILMILSISVLGACTSTETPTEVPESPTEPAEAPTATVAQPETTSPPEPVMSDEILNITWMWTTLVVQSTGAQEMVPNPENYTIVFREDGSVNVQADCNMVIGTYSRDGGLTITLGPSTMAFCGEDSLDQPYLALLSNVVTGGPTGDGNLALESAGGAERMIFVNGGPAGEPEEPDTPEITCDAGNDPATVTLDTMGLPYSYQPNCVPATPYDNTQPPGPTGLPDHIQVNFGVEGQQEMLPNNPIIYIIPVEDYVQLWEEAGDESVSNSIERLRELLQEKPEPVPTSGKPILPMERVMGVSDLQVQGMYLDILMGSGVRFVTRFSQGPNPVTSDNPQMFYTFQGFSWDGEDLITFFHPVTTSALPTSDSVSPEEQEQVATDPEGYLEEKAADLDALSTSDWEPDLTTLDAVIGSLLYGELPEMKSMPPTPEGEVPSATTLEPLNVRSGPGTEYPSYGTVPLGTTFEVVGVSEDGGWWVGKIPTTVALSGQGWVNGNYVETTNTDNVPVAPTPPLDEVEVPVPEPGVPTATAFEPINVRSGPSNQYPSYGVAPAGASGEVIGISEDGGWWVVKIPTDVAPDGQGWVNANYVETTNTDNVPVIPTPALP